MKFFDDPTLEIIKLNMEEIVATSFGDEVYGETEIDDTTDESGVINQQ